MSWYFLHQSATSVVTQLLTTFSSGDSTNRILIWLNAGHWLRLLTAGPTPIFEIKKTSSKVHWLEKTMVWMVIKRFYPSVGIYCRYIQMKSPLCSHSIQTLPLLPADLWDKVEFKKKYTELNGSNPIIQDFENKLNCNFPVIIYTYFLNFAELNFSRLNVSLANGVCISSFSLSVCLDYSLWM